MIIHEELLQKTSDWKKIRAEKITSSDFKSLAKKPDGAITKGENTVLNKILTAVFLGVWDVSELKLKAFDHGNKYEPIALIELQKKLSDHIIEPVGFIEHSRWLGISPDGIIRNPKDHNKIDHVIEIKNPETGVNHMHCLLRDEVPDENIDQCLGAIFLTGAKSCFFCSSMPIFINENGEVEQINKYRKKHMYIKEIFPSDYQKRYDNLSQRMMYLSDYLTQSYNYLLDNWTDSLC